MSGPVVIRNARIFGTDQQVNLSISGGRIESLDGSAPGDGDVTDARGMYVVPGLVDLRARMVSRDELRAATSGGVTHAVLPPDTRVHMDDAVEVRDLLQVLSNDARIHWIGAWTRHSDADALSDMASLRSAGCFAVGCGNSWVPNSLVMRSAMQYAADLGLKLFITPRDPQLAGDGCAHAGRIATRLGLAGIPAAAETAALARDLALVEEIGAPTHFGPLSCAASVDLIRRAQGLGLPVTADTAIHHLFLTDMDLVGFDARCHVDPPLRDQADRDSLLRGVRDGVLSISSDHRPLSADAKMAPFPATEPGMANVQLLFPLGWRLIEEGLLTAQQVMNAMVHRPAAFVGLEDRDLAPGGPADLFLFDPDPMTPVDVHHSDWSSDGLHTAFSGWTLTGRVEALMVNGRWCDR